jgi:hypothetical protein
MRVWLLPICRELPANTNPWRKLDCQLRSRYHETQRLTAIGQPYQ